MLDISRNPLNTELKVKNIAAVESRMAVGLSVADPCAHEADWELRLSAATQHQQSDHVLLAQGKVNTQSTTSTEYTSLPFYYTVKEDKPNYFKSGAVCTENCSVTNRML